MGGEVAPMERETKQRDGILKGLDDAREQDLVLISDVDEIVKRDTMLLLRVCQDFWAVNGLFFWRYWPTHVLVKWFVCLILAHWSLCYCLIILSKHVIHGFSPPCGKSYESYVW